MPAYKQSDVCRIRLIDDALFSSLINDHMDIHGEICFLWTIRLRYNQHLNKSERIYEDKLPFAKIHIFLLTIYNAGISYASCQTRGQIVYPRDGFEY